MEEKDNKQVKQVKMELELPLSTKQKLMIGGGMLLSVAAGYAIGYSRCHLQTARGIELCWLEDPTLKEHMWKVMDSVKEKLK